MRVRKPSAFMIRLAAVVLAGCSTLACHESAPNAAPPAAGTDIPAVGNGPPPPPAPPVETGGFQPLGSQKVKDAIHAALATGTTQRWADGDYGGYAVPGPPGANGCRQVRYTVDQRPADVQQITACDASRTAWPPH